MVKRIVLKAIVRDEVERKDVRFEGLVEMESYEEKQIPKEKGVLEEHSFDELMDGAVEVANAAWMLVKGFMKMSKWAIIIIIEGLRWLWRGGVGKEAKHGKAEKGK